MSPRLSCPPHPPSPGTRTGITACQLDVKLPGGVPLSIVEEALAAAARGRAKILSAMEAALPEVGPDRGLPAGIHNQKAWWAGPPSGV